MPYFFKKEKDCVHSPEHSRKTTLLHPLEIALSFTISPLFLQTLLASSCYCVRLCPPPSCHCPHLLVAKPVPDQATLGKLHQARRPGFLTRKTKTTMYAFTKLPSGALGRSMEGSYRGYLLVRALYLITNSLKIKGMMYTSNVHWCCCHHHTL